MTPSHHCEFTSAHRFTARDAETHPQVFDKLDAGSSEGSSDLLTICESLNWKEKWQKKKKRRAYCRYEQFLSFSRSWREAAHYVAEAILLLWIWSVLTKRRWESGGGLVKLLVSHNHPEVIVHWRNAKDKTKQQQYPNQNFRPVFHWFLGFIPQ